MRSATSYFNPTLYRKNLTRFWPIWGLYGVIWLLVLPVSLLTEADPGYAQRHPLRLLPEGALGMAVVFAILTAMAVFSYLYSSRSVGMFHALPMRREGLFLTNYLSGLSFLLLPNLAVFLLALLAEATTGTLAFSSLFLWLVVTSLLDLFFFSFAVFCAMFTGHLLALPAFYGILNALASVVVLLFESLAQSYLFGYTGTDGLERAAEWLTPILKLTNGMRAYGDSTGVWRFSGLSYVLLYALVGLVLTGIALAVYRRRQLETAGDVVSVGWVRPVFKYGVAACCAVVLGLFLYGEIFYDLVPHGPWTLLVFMLLCGALGYFLADMLLRKTFRVFRGNWKGCAALLVCLTLFMCVLEFDLFGVERRVPDAALVESVSLSSIDSYPRDDMSYAAFDVTDPEQIALVTRLHQSIVDRRDELEDMELNGWIAEARDDMAVQTEGFAYIRLEYTLSSGRVLKREYSIPVTEAGLDTDGTPEALLTRLINIPSLVEENYFGSWNENWRLVDAVVYNAYLTGEGSYTDLYVDSAVYDDLLAALRADIQAGDLGRRYLLEDEDRLENCCISDLELTFAVPEEELRDTSSPVLTTEGNTTYSTAPSSRTVTITIGLEKSAARTMAALRAGILEAPGDYRLLTHADSYRLEDTGGSPTEDAEVTVPAGVHAIP